MHVVTLLGQVVNELPLLEAERADVVVEVELFDVLVLPRPPTARSMTVFDKLEPGFEDVPVFGEPGRFVCFDYPACEDRIGDTVGSCVVDSGSEACVFAEPIP
jgi:hypothetical protein